MNQYNMRRHTIYYDVWDDANSIDKYNTPLDTIYYDARDGVDTMD